jgi:hypothetical protein
VGQRYLPAEQPGEGRAGPRRAAWALPTVLVLLAVALSVTVFRGAYEQAATPWRCGPTPG